jgi:hypothetical protein
LITPGLVSCFYLFPGLFLAYSPGPSCCPYSPKCLEELVALLLEELQVRVSTREGKATVGKAEEVLLLVVDKVGESLLSEEHLCLVEGFGLAAPELCGRYGPLLAIHPTPRAWALLWSPSKCTAKRSPYPHSI